MSRVSDFCQINATQIAAIDKGQVRLIDFEKKTTIQVLHLPSHIGVDRSLHFCQLFKTGYLLTGNLFQLMLVDLGNRDTLNLVNHPDF